MSDRIADLKELLAEDPDDAMGWFMLGQELFKAGEIAEATDAFKDATRRDPDYSAAWAGLGRGLEAQGDLAAAKDAWSAAVSCASRQGDKAVLQQAEAALKRLA